MPVGNAEKILVSIILLNDGSVTDDDLGRVGDFYCTGNKMY